MCFYYIWPSHLFLLRLASGGLKMVLKCTDLERLQVVHYLALPPLGLNQMACVKLAWTVWFQ